MTSNRRPFCPPRHQLEARWQQLLQSSLNAGAHVSQFRTGTSNLVPREHCPSLLHGKVFIAEHKDRPTRSRRGGASRRSAAAGGGSRGLHREQGTPRGGRQHHGGNAGGWPPDGWRGAKAGGTGHANGRGHARGEALGAGRAHRHSRTHHHVRRRPHWHHHGRSHARKHSRHHTRHGWGAERSVA